MAKEIEQTKKELKEQNRFLQSVLRSIEDIKKGKIKKFGKAHSLIITLM